jgi:hypothetical protein
MFPSVLHGRLWSELVQLAHMGQCYPSPTNGRMDVLLLINDIHVYRLRHLGNEIDCCGVDCCWSLVYRLCQDVP